MKYCFVPVSPNYIKSLIIRVISLTAFRCQDASVREQPVTILTDLVTREFVGGKKGKLFPEMTAILPADTGNATPHGLRSARQHGFAPRQWTYRRTRPQQLLPGTPLSGQLGQWRTLQTASPHTRLPVKEIALAVNQRSSDGSPGTLFFFIIAFIWTQIFTDV